MLMSIDMELSCDERVLKEMDKDIKKSYANSLLSLATGRYILNGSPLAFGEGNVQGKMCIRDRSLIGLSRKLMKLIKTALYQIP